MTNKKELNLEDLEKVTGGVFTDETCLQLIKNSKAFQELYNQDPVKYTEMSEALDNMFEGSETYTFEDIKKVIASYGFDVSKLVY